MITSLTSATKNTKTTKTTKNTNKAIAAGAVVLATLLTACGTDTADLQDDATTAAPIAAEATVVTEAPTTDTPVVEAPKTTSASAEATRTEAPAGATPVDAEKTGAPTANTPAPKAITNSGPCPTYTVDNTFPIGLCAKGDLVTDVQEALRYVIVATQVDGYYGPDTEGTVRMLQSSFGLPETGIVDEATYQAIVEAGYDDEEEVADWHDKPIWDDEAGMNAGHDPEYYDNDDDGTKFIERCNDLVDLAIADRADPNIDEDELNMCIAILGH